MSDGDLELFERSLRHAVSAASGAALDAALEDLGWHDALTVDTKAAVSLLFELQGRANATSSALDHILGQALGCSPPVVFPAIGRNGPPGTLAGNRLAVDGLATTTATSAVVVAGTCAYEVRTASLSVRAVAGMDPMLGVVRLSGEVDGPDAIGPVDWSRAICLGQMALGHELVGASRHMLELARQHALDRIQFGQPIARFQAVRHRLAETLVAIESAAALLDTAWLSPTPQGAAMAKAMAGRAARTAARHCQQVLAGIGFTTEHPFHRYVKRVLVLDQLLGSSVNLTRELGAEVLARHELPPLVPL